VVNFSGLGLISNNSFFEEPCRKDSCTNESITVYYCTNNKQNPIVRKYARYFNISIFCHRLADGGLSERTAPLKKDDFRGLVRIMQSGVSSGIH